MSVRSTLFRFALPALALVAALPPAAPGVPLDDHALLLTVECEGMRFHMIGTLGAEPAGPLAAGPAPLSDRALIDCIEVRSGMSDHLAWRFFGSARTLALPGDGEALRSVPPRPLAFEVTAGPGVHPEEISADRVVDWTRRVGRFLIGLPGA